MCEIMCSYVGNVMRCPFGHDNLGRWKLNYFHNPDIVGFVDVHLVAPILCWYWTHIPSIQAMCISAGVLLGFFIGNYYHACQGPGSVV
jgi:hypothetical protein